MRTFLCVLAFTIPVAVQAEPVKAAKAPPASVSFSLKDADGKVHSLAEYMDSKAVVVVFLGTQCPINNAYVPVLAELHKEFGGKGIRFLGVNSNVQDTPQDVAQHAKDHKAPFPIVKDTGNTVADAFEAERTPEVFVLDPTGKVLYRGRIDDRNGYRHRRDKPTRRDLACAIEEVLAGKAVTTATTAVEGCLISRVSKTRDAGQITYAKHISRFMQKNCQECHRPGQIGPFSLLTYDDAVAWSAMIREVVENKTMPPWHADPKHGKFTNDRALSSEERDTLLKWLDGGMPRGDSKEMPEARKWPEGWMIGKPDAVIEMPRTFTVPAKSEKSELRYQYFLVPTKFEEDVWVQAAEVRPGNRKVVHHILAYVQAPGERRERIDGIGAGMLAAYAPGDMPSIFPLGSAKKIAKGSILVFQMHYTPVGTEEQDRSSVGLILSKKPPQTEAKTRAISTNRFSIPPGDNNHKVTSSTTFRQDAQLLSFLPHMHLRGKSFEYKVVFPDGKTQTLLSVPRYDFNWQTIYRLDKPLDLPAGTRIDCTAYFDNSSENLNNPNPKATVRWGEQTWEEMMIGFVDYVHVKKDAEK